MVLINHVLNTVNNVAGLVMFKTRLIITKTTYEVVSKPIPAPTNMDQAQCWLASNPEISTANTVQPVCHIRIRKACCTGFNIDAARTGTATLSDNKKPARNAAGRIS